MRLVCRRFQETTHYTLHATACLDQHLITISSPTVLQSLIVSAAVWPPLPRPPSLSLSLSLSRCPSTARTGTAWENCRLKSRAEHAELWPPGGSSDIAIDCVTLGLVDKITQLTLGLLGRGLRAADRNRAA